MYSLRTFTINFPDKTAVLRDVGASIAVCYIEIKFISAEKQDEVTKFLFVPGPQPADIFKMIPTCYFI